MREVATQAFVITEHIDPDLVGSGGIDGMIVDFVAHFSSTYPISVVGVSTVMKVGTWTDRELGGVSVRFLPIAHLDKRRRRRIPHSMTYALALGFHRRLFPNGIAQAHRVETAAILRLARRDYALFIHNDIEGIAGPGSESFWRRIPWLYGAIEKFAVRGALRCGIFSGDGAARIRQYHPSIVRLFSWFDPRVFYPPTDSAQRDVPRVLWVGRLEMQKDPILALRAFAEFHTRAKAVLCVVGAGELMDEVHRAATELGLSGVVTFAGAVPKARVAELMRDADLLLMTSRFEGSPTVLVEAAATGLRVACTPEADTDKFLTNGGCGAVAPSREPADVADAMQRALSLVRERAEIASAVRDRSLEVGIERFAAVAVGTQAGDSP